MLLCAFSKAGERAPGVIVDNIVYRLEGDFFSGGASAGEKIGSLQEVTLLPPVLPGKLICVGRNYAAHAAERNEEVPKEPLLFFKPPSAIIGPEQSIQRLPEMGLVDHEAELVVVIGKRGRFITEDQALDYVFGYTCANDVSERDYQKKDGQWTRAKGFDTFCPLGPWINTDLDASDLAVTCKVNGELRQDSRTSLMVFKIHTLIAHISRIMTLEPGDLILTGTPAGVGPLLPGDEVEVEVEGIGKLKNTVSLLEK